MTEQQWSVLLLGCDLAGLVVYALVIARRIWWGWLMTASVIALPWLAYSILGPERRPAFTVLAAVWLFVHLRNAILWRGNERTR